MEEYFKYHIPCSEANCFDSLSILEIKADIRVEAISNYTNLYWYLRKMFGIKFDEVFNSQEYDLLYRANSEVFRLVDLARKDEVKASQVVIANDKRMEMKLKLQEKFFKDSILNEQKF